MNKSLARIVFLLTWSFMSAFASDTTMDLPSKFKSPPDSSKPWVYWWWLNGNVSREGITSDLEEMKRQGINGVLIFNAGGGKGPSGPKFLSPEWRDLFKFALREADRLRMEVSVNLCDGWDAGGPWITPDCANKKLVYSEMQVDGPGRIERTLPSPPSLDQFYHDSLVVAFPERLDRPLSPASVTASSTLGGYCDEWNFPPEDAVDGDPETYWSSAKEGSAPDKPAWLAVEYSEPLTATSAYLLLPHDSAIRECELQIGSDPGDYSTITRLNPVQGSPVRVEFPEVHARRFRLLIKSTYSGPLAISEFAILRKGDSANPRPGIKWWAFKSGNRSFWDYPRLGPAVLSEEHPEDGTSDSRSADVVDLTGKMDERGQLRWDAPPGRWTILRVGYTLVGQRTRCGTTVVGYESDMLSEKGIDTHFKATALPLIADAREAGAHSLKYLHIDSYEIGADIRGQQPTWVEDFREAFAERRGYDLLPYLPALARRIVDSREVTNRFLWDYRRTIGDLIAERFFGRFAQLGHEHGMLVHSETGYGTYPWPHIDGLQCAGKNDITMGEFWIGTDIMSQFNHWGNVIKTVSSAAHTYGRNIVQAEAFTSWNHWVEYPASLKPVGDEAFCNGLNRMVFHQYTHQPYLDLKPGYQYGAGTHFDRNLTWWEQSRAFFEYLSRCQFMLQQGRPAADVCWFYGEGVTAYVPSKEFVRPAIAPGYDFDAINAEVLLHRLVVKDGKLALPEGPAYSALLIAENAPISPEVLARIRSLIEDAAVVVGTPPSKAPGLTGFPACDSEVERIARQIWGNEEGSATVRSNGGKSIAVHDSSLSDVLQSHGVSPDFEVLDPGLPNTLRFVHRTLREAEIYFVANTKEEWFRSDVAFRVTGMQPELWDPVTGEIHVIPSFRQRGPQTMLPLDLAPYGSAFVVFRGSVQDNGDDRTANERTDTRVVMTLDGPWQVDFDPQGGGPANVTFDSLTDWSHHSDPAIRYFSGKATYRIRFNCDALPAPNSKLYIDLGKVKNIAEMTLNRKQLGVIWTAPWRADVTDLIRSKDNALEITIVNLWPNRIIGDAQLPQHERRTVTNVRFAPDAPLLESGLLGPVTVQWGDL